MLALAAGACVLAFLANVGIEGEPTYVGSEACNNATCHHDTQFTYWRATGHGTDFVSGWKYNGKLTNIYTNSGGNTTTGKPGNCAPCHTVGYKETWRGGFDPTKPWNATSNLPVIGIGCEDCHGPGSEQVREPALENINVDRNPWFQSCAGTQYQQCHSGLRQYGNDTIPGFEDSAHMSGYPPYVKNNPDALDCAHCMESKTVVDFWTGERIKELPDDPLWNITCAVCHDPHPDPTKIVEFQLRVPADEVCERCHHGTEAFPSESVRHPTTEFRKGINGQGVPVTPHMPDTSCPDCHMYTSPRGTPVKDTHLSHTWDPAPQACVVCHSEYTNETADDAIHRVQEHVAKRLVGIEPVVAEMKVRRAYAMANGLWTGSANTSYNEAMWDLQYVQQEGSGGVHNPPFADALLDAVGERAEGIIENLTVGGVSGSIAWSDGAPLDGAQLKDGDGIVVATTAANGSYFFFTKAGKRSFIVAKDGKVLGAIEDVQVPELSNVTVAKAVIERPAAAEEDEGGLELDALSYILIAVIVVLVIALAIMTMRRGRAGPGQKAP